MKNILLKEMTLDPASDLVELICSTRMKVTCKIEKGMSHATVDCIIKIEDDTIAYTIRHDHNRLMLEFEDDDEMITFEVNAHYLTDMVIR